MSSSFDQLTLVSYLAPNMFWFYKAVGAYLSRVLDIETHVVQSQHDPLKDPVMLQDRLDIAFICGLPFIQLNSVLSGQLQALVAPVMQASRYQNCPVYFSDIIVNADSNLNTFDDLAGKTLCYNDPGSNSGYNLLRYRLLESSHEHNFFDKAIQSGSHQRSIQLVAEGIADCAAIDSTVLEQELLNLPQLSKHLRVVESMGPHPIPLVAIAQRLDAKFIALLQSALCQPDIELQSAMQKALIQRYVPVQIADYAAIGIMYDTVVQAGYEITGM